MRLRSWVLLISGCVCALPSKAAPGPHVAESGLLVQVRTREALDGASVDWDVAFANRAREPGLHFVAHYQDAHGVTHRLEVWRQGDEHLRRRTDDRIDLHADAMQKTRPGQAADYVWQVIDREKKIDHRVSTHGMLRAGMFYNYWSMAHVLTRPAGRFQVTRLENEAGVRVGGVPCTWYQVAPDGQPATRVCWAAEVAVPLRTESQDKDGRWATMFLVQSIERRRVPAAVFAVNLAGLQVRDVDELGTED